MPHRGIFYEGFMNKLYFILATLVAFLFMFFAGHNNGMQKCQKNVTQNALQQQSEIIQIKEKINAETVASRTDDIRKCLRQKYTIAD
jgi:hypothetical protein